MVTVAGSRAQAIALSYLSGRLREQHEEVFVFCPPTDDLRASDGLWQQLGLSQPRYQWALRADSPARRVAQLIVRLEGIMRRERPDIVLVHGGTDAAMAGALVAAQLNFASAHIEAGLRAPQVCAGDEVNRQVADRLASFCFCATEGAAARLAGEGVAGGLYAVGDPAFDALAAIHAEGREGQAWREELGLEADGYYLAAVSLPEREGGKAKLGALLAALMKLSPPVVLAAHPRARLVMHEANMGLPQGVRGLEPLEYSEMLAVEAGAKAIVTDSAGVQREAIFLGVPCVAVGEPAWPEAVEAGLLAGAEPTPEAIAGAVKAATKDRSRGGCATWRGGAAHAFGDGHASERIVEILSGETSPGSAER